MVNSIQNISISYTFSGNNFAQDFENYNEAFAEFSKLPKSFSPKVTIIANGEQRFVITSKGVNVYDAFGKNIDSMSLEWFEETNKKKLMPEWID